MNTNTILGLLENLLIHTFIPIDSTECILSLMYSLSLTTSLICDVLKHTQNWFLAMSHLQFLSGLWYTIHHFCSELLLLQDLLMVLESSVLISFHETCLSSFPDMKLRFYVQKWLYSPIEKFQWVRKF